MVLFCYCAFGPRSTLYRRIIAGLVGWKLAYTNPYLFFHLLEFDIVVLF